MTIRQSPTILIVDDVPGNISTLFTFLDANNFEVLVAQNGEAALELIEYELPDLILLDIMMSGISGFETCRQLKANVKTQDIPIIFMTALSDTSDKVKGFELGAVDYVTKPIQQKEVLARINTHLTIFNLQQQLQTKNAELATKNAELATKNAELDAFSHTVAHDLKNPLSHLISMSDILLEEFSGEMNSYANQCVQHIFQSSEKMIGIVNALLLLASVSKQDIELVPLDMGDIIYRVQQRLTTMVTQYQGEMIISEKWPIVVGYAPWVEEIWVNYLSNGLKYGGHPPRLEVGATPDGDMIRFWVRDNGSGLSQEAIGKLFTPFTRLHQTQEEGHGLGLSIVQRIVKKLDGQVGVESQLDNGCVFYFTLNKSVLEIVEF
jgi:two-component system sensor histidine kinase/response regulator